MVFGKQLHVEGEGLQRKKAQTVGESMSRLSRSLKKEAEGKAKVNAGCMIGCKQLP